MATQTLPLTREIFDNGLTWESYLDSMQEHAQTTRRLYERARVDAPTVERFARLAERLGGELSISAMTHDWCGDSAVVLPIVARLASSVPAIRFRVLIGSSVPAVRDAYIADGFESIPLLSFFDASWDEKGRWMERPKSANDRVEKWVAEHPRVGELHGSDDPADKEELTAIFAGLVDEMAEWYPSGLWQDVLSEIEKLLQ